MTTLADILATAEGPLRLVVGKSLSINFESGESQMVHTVHMYEEPDQPRRKAQQIGPVLVGDSFSELLSAVATVLDEADS